MRKLLVATSARPGRFPNEPTGMDKYWTHYALNAFLVLTTATLTTFGQFAWKLATQHRLEGGPLTLSALSAVFFSRWFAAGMLCYGASTVFWVIQLSRFPLFIAFAATTALVFLFTALIDLYFFSVPFSGMQWIGTALLMLGIGLMLPH